MNGNVQPYNTLPSGRGWLREASSMSQAWKPLAGYLLLGALVLAVSIDLNRARLLLGRDPRNVCRPP